MKPYFQDDAVTIYHGDCREILPQVTGYDCVLTDPPYGIDGGRGGGNTARAKGVYDPQGWEDTPLYIENVVAPIVASLDVRMAITPGIRCAHLYPVPADMGCFWTPAAAGHGSWGLITFNPIYYYGKDPRKGTWPTGKQVTERPGIDGHPCPKPLKAWTWLLQKVSAEPGETVLDPFMGSGTTLRAAKDLGRKAIGIEIEERYCEIAAKRMAQGVLL